jgi:AraC-like DNA-binding protein
MLFYVERGQVILHIDGQSFEARQRTLLILPMGLPYQREFKRATRLIFVFFAPCRFEFDDAPRALEIVPDDVAVRCMQHLAVLQKQGNAQREISDHLLAALLSRLKQIEGREAALKALHPGVAASVQWIDDHLEESINLEALAAHAHCSPSHLRAVFKQQVGSSILRYQQDQRMQYALKLLNQPHLSLREVAQRCGYADVEYFSRLFRRYHSTSPGKLRRQRASVL